MIKVAKFGGSSVANADQFRKVRHIIDSDPARKFIVTSACGKESHEDHKVTDLLYLIEAHVKYGVGYDDLFQLIVDKYQRIEDALGLHVDLKREFDHIRELIDQGESEDYLVSRGEYLTARLLAEYLDAQFVDAADVITFGYEGGIDMERTGEKLRQYALQADRIVIPGFYGALPNGSIRVMSRGGSDITGSVIANVINADVYENWTDVSGIMIADPRIVEHPLSIPRITYSELREMSYMGANVLHDDAVFPVREKNIPINIRNTNEPDAPGTMIMEDCSAQDEIDPPHAITGITGRKNFTVITVSKAHCSAKVGYLRTLLQCFEDNGVSVESAPTTVDTMSIIVDTARIEKRLYEVIGLIKERCEPDDIRIEGHVAQIAIVGREMCNQPGISGALLSEFGRSGINIRTINQTSDELSIVVGVDDRSYEKAIQAIYAKFIKEERKNSL
jgi:aspartate kinase